MRTNPRQHILDTWRAFARVAIDNGEWAWGGRAGSNSISDAEQLLCLLYPATEVPGFRLHRPDAIHDDVLTVLKPLGDGLDIPMRILEALEQYLDRHTGEQGPVFAAGSAVQAQDPAEEATAEQQAFDLTDSYSVSITLCLSAKGFLREFQRTVERPNVRDRIDAVLSRLEDRLTAAMIGLLRSFVVDVLDPDSDAEHRLMRTVGQGRVVGRTLIQDLRTRLQPVRDKLPELTFGLPPENERVLRDYPERFFECGWTWGVAHDAPNIDLPAAAEVPQPRGAAEARPSLHFTVGALNGLADLFSLRTSRQGLLTSGQQPLREALSLRWGLASQYWSTIASFGSGTWPVEDVPWENSAGQSSAYFSALVLSIMGTEQPLPAGSAQRCVGVLAELAQRGLVNRRAEPDNRAIALHHPGVALPLGGMEQHGPPLVLVHTGYAATLAKTALLFASRTAGRRDRARLIETADAAVDHLLLRRHQATGLWDDPGNAFPGIQPAPAVPDWSMSEHAVEVFVAAATLASAPPQADQGQIDQAESKLAEAWHILDQERLNTPTAGGAQEQKLLREVQQALTRAASLAPTRPATAAALVDRALRDLDELAFARQAATGSA
ncbi:SCO2524 family protein [Catenulispora yoronensis]|uniref:SCO2524 family protein n=1 Tax=Catenulispora yoronensis TaxID=450799 RepID=UPI0031D6AD24